MAYKERYQRERIKKLKFRTYIGFFARIFEFFENLFGVLTGESRYGTDGEKSCIISRVRQFDDALAENSLDFRLLRELCFGGIPEGKNIYDSWTVTKFPHLFSLF